MTQRESHNPLTIGECALLMRRKAGLSQNELGKLAGVSRNTISSFERGDKKLITIGTMASIFTALGADLIITVQEKEK